jgi:hypothetical protein
VNRLAYTGSDALRTSVGTFNLSSVSASIFTPSNQADGICRQGIGLSVDGKWVYLGRPRQRVVAAACILTRYDGVDKYDNCYRVPHIPGLFSRTLS